MNFEEMKDSMPQVNHISRIQDRIRETLTSAGKKYNGQELDGMLYPPNERVIIATHKGPMLAKFDAAKPQMEVRYEIKKTSGSGKGSLAGKRAVDMNWFKKGGRLYLDPISGRGGQESVGWSDVGIDSSKSGSIYSSISEWLPQMGLTEVDAVSMGGLLDALSGKEDYTMLFVKGVLILRTLCVKYSVAEAKIGGASRLPEYVAGDKRKKIGQIGAKECTIDIDRLSEKEMLVAMMSSMEYPSILCAESGVPCVYSRISIAKCDVTFVGKEGHKINKVMPTPERWWKAMIGLASKLGAVDDLIKAFRVTRGLGSWIDGLDILGVEEFGMSIDVPPTRGCRSVLMDSNLTRLDRVEKPSNLACSLGELVCDWAAGLEMRNLLVHISDEFGLANHELNRNVTNLEGCSVGDSLMREAGIMDYGRDNVFYNKMCERVSSGVKFIGNSDIKDVIRLVGKKMMESSSNKKVKEEMSEFKNLAFTAYFGSVWSENCTKVVGNEGKINSRTWGATSRSRSEVYELRCWLDMYGLSEKVLTLCGYNAVQKMGLEAISQNTMSRIEGANGVYTEVYREVNWKSIYEARVGSETLEKDRLEFMKTYLGMEDECEEVEKEVVVRTVPVVETEGETPFRGSLGGRREVPVEDDGERKEDGEEEGIPDVTRTVKATPKKTVVKPVRRRVVLETFSSSGVSGFVREVSTNGANMKVRKTPPDGYCVAHAIAEGLADIGVKTSSKEMIEWLQKETESPNWFEVETAAYATQKLGVGVVIYDRVRNKLLGIGTKGRGSDSIIGITYDGNHCDVLTRGICDYVVPQVGDVVEQPIDDMREILKALFSG